MRTALVYLLLVAAPTAVLWGARVALERWTRPAHGGGVTGTRPVERVAADLARLEREYRATERADVPGRASRLRALRLAYDDTLRDGCRAVGLTPPPGRAALDAVDRLHLEAALAQRGLAW